VQQRQYDKGNNTSATAQTHQLDGGNNASATTVTTLMEFEGKEVSVIRTTIPRQQGQQYPCNVGDGTSATRATTPLCRWQRCLHINNGNNTIVTRATKSA
jgi:hypothetical protein